MRIKIRNKNIPCLLCLPVFVDDANDDILNAYDSTYT